MTRVQVAPRVIPVTMSTTSPLVSVFWLGRLDGAGLDALFGEVLHVHGTLGHHHHRKVHLRQHLLGFVDDMRAHISQMEDGDLVARYLFDLLFGFRPKVGP